MPIQPQVDQITKELIILLNKKPIDYRKKLKLETFTADYKLEINNLLNNAYTSYTNLGIEPVGLKKAILKQVILNLFYQAAYSKMYRFKSLN